MSEPELLSDPCPPKTRADLEWDRVLEALELRASLGVGKRLSRALPFLSTRAEILRALGEVKEALDLDLAGEPLPIGEAPEVEGALERVRIGAPLGNEELRAVIAVLGLARGVRRFLFGRRDKAPLLEGSCAMDPSLDDLERNLARAFDPDGSLSDRASPKLESLRAERRHSRDRLVRRLEELIQKHEDIVQDRFWTERDGRYVLPVRTDAHERFPGIVHATSSSGSTVFVEPRVLVEMGNRQKMLDAQVAREEEAIYAALSEQVSHEVEGIAAAVRALAHADVRRAGARLAKDLDLAFPDVPAANDEGGRSIDLKQGRHVLLELDLRTSSAPGAVVASDLVVDAGHAMVVSGPNAGGKTVALKTLGLAALLVRAGLPVPGKHTSKVGVFDVVLTDVGDDQSLHKNLSTFSAHVKNLAAILDDARPGALVVLDELAGGTDPREGEALAAAVLDSLCARGATVACTTHYEGLKALALGDGRFRNASVGFDVETMSPTFRVLLGIPGASSALAVARRFGIPSTVTERAERFLSKETVTFDEMVEKLQAERRALELARADAEREAESLRERRAEVERELARLGEKEKLVLSREGEALLASVKRAREDLRAAQARLRGGKATEADLKAAAKAIDAVAHRTSIGGELEPRVDREERPTIAAKELRPGMRVYVPRLRAEAEIIEVNGDMLRVTAGALKLTVNAIDVRAGATGTQTARDRERERDRERAKRATPFDPAADPDVPIQTSENTVDVRGLRAHEAIAMTEQFLDRALGGGRKVAFVVHGHGTGALRDSIRSSLRESRVVARSRPGESGEGGDGVTVVWLKW